MRLNTNDLHVPLIKKKVGAQKKIQDGRQIQDGRRLFFCKFKIIS